MTGGLIERAGVKGTDAYEGLRIRVRIRVRKRVRICLCERIRILEKFAKT